MSYLKFQVAMQVQPADALASRLHFRRGSIWNLRVTLRRIVMGGVLALTAACATPAAMMSEHVGASLVIPEVVKSAYRATARSEPERRSVERLIARGDEAEDRQYASIVQNKVLAAVRSDNVFAALAASEELLGAARSSDLSAAVAKEITFEALKKQTSDLAERAQGEAAAERAAEQ